jgi:hypothetical protein
MKSSFVLAGLSVVALSLTGCKSEEEKQAEATVDNYTRYVDSVNNIAADQAKANWQAIESGYNQRTADAEAALANMKDKSKAEEKVNDSKAKYESLKAKYQTEMEAAAPAPADRKTEIRNSFWGEGKVGDDMSFDWVNKDNILKAYNDFYNAYDANKDSYSREDFDEVKAIYEALDARKNTVEKEGLSSHDNMKIAELKVKFAPKFKIDRMKAKGDENQDAKDDAK